MGWMPGCARASAETCSTWPSSGPTSASSSRTDVGRDGARRDALRTLAEAEARLGSQPRARSGAIFLRPGTRPRGRGSPRQQESHRGQPRTAWEWYALGRSLLRSGKLDAAAVAYDRAAELQPARPLDPVLPRPMRPWRRGRFAEAVDAFGASVALAPGAGVCYHNRGLAYEGPRRPRSRPPRPRTGPPPARSEAGRPCLGDDATAPEFGRSSEARGWPVGGIIEKNREDCSNKWTVFTSCSSPMQNPRSSGASPRPLLTVHFHGNPFADVRRCPYRVDTALRLPIPPVAPFHCITRRRQQLVIQERQRLLQVR